MSELLSQPEIAGSEQLHEKDQHYYLPVFKRLPLAFERGEGCTLWDVDGNQYLDALAGIAVNSLGHAHPRVTERIQQQAAALLHVSNFFVTRPQMELAEKLTRASGLDYVFFTNSGTEAYEGAIKIARKHAHENGRGGTIISMHGAFHGRTLAAIAAGKPQMQKGFGPMPEGFKQIPFNDIEAVKEVISNDVAAVILEPVQGEGGINVAQKEYLQQVRELCDEHNIVLIFDEIQCGVGRTGTLFAKEQFGVEPDIMTLAKALGNGVPIGAILSNRKVSKAIEYGDHGTTFGGNPLACAAGLAVIETISAPDFLDQVQQKGRMLKEQLMKLKEEFSFIREIRGLGLMLGVEFDFETKELVKRMLANGVIANATAGNVLRLVPPLIISEEEIGKLVEVIRTSIKEIREEEGQ